MQSQLDALNAFFARPLCIQAAKPLSKKASIRVQLPEGNFLLQKEDDKLVAEPEPEKAQPDLSFRVPEGALQPLLTDDSKELGELAVKLLRLIATSEPERKIRPSIHIGAVDFVLKGYAGLVTAGGAPLMKYLASRGLGSLGQIKKTLASFRTES